MNLYINLPVTDLSKATAFYETIGFTKNADFSNENATALSYKNSFYVMLLTHAFAKTFLPHKEIADSKKTCEVLNAIQLNTKEEVDELMKIALQAGGNEFREAYDHGFMYGRDFEDIDGHIRELFWMDAGPMDKE